MKPGCFLFINLFFISIFSYSQKEASNWYFGRRAGMNFNGGSPVNITNGQINAYEGTAVISDRFGKLLFYTDGEIIWNKNHAVMTNGYGLNGYNSCTQPCLIVPAPCDSNKYYIFQTDGVTFDPASGRNNYPFDSIFSYSMVDMKASGGLGAIIQKNIKLYSPVNETVAAVKHANGIDTWVMTHQVTGNKFIAFLVTASGISAPVISPVGPVFDDFPVTHLKFSPNGKRVSMSFGFTSGSLYGRGNMHVFDFDNSTGFVSNPKDLGVGTGAYGHSFSSNSDFLYVSEGQFLLVQYDLLAGGGSAADISASRVIIYGNDATYNTYFGWAIQNGIDGKMYVSHDYSAQPNYLGVINNPNEKGKGCNYVHAGFNLGAANKKENGLPNFIESYFDPNYQSLFPGPGINLSDTLTITPDELSVDLNPLTTGVSYVWTPTTDLSCSNCPNPVATPPGTTNYFVTITDFDGCITTNTITVLVLTEETIYIPNSFTPNGDGQNDFLKIYGNGIQEIELSIFNRWGKMVFKSSHIQEEWDGKYRTTAVEEGIYTYYLHCGWKSGNEKTTIGKVNVIR